MGRKKLQLDLPALKAKRKRWLERLRGELVEMAGEADWFRVSDEDLWKRYGHLTIEEAFQEASENSERPCMFDLLDEPVVKFRVDDE